jgi:PAS domain S-box-containing protein
MKPGTVPVSGAHEQTAGKSELQATVRVLCRFGTPLDPESQNNDQIVIDRTPVDEDRNHAATSVEWIPENARINRTILDAIPGFIAYWNKELRCQFANEAYADWFGKPLEAIIGARMQDVVSARLFALNEPYVRAVLAGQRQEFERPLKGPDGQIGHFLANYVPDIVAGEVVGFVAQTTDVTLLKNAEAALRRAEREQLYSATVESSQDAIVTKTLDGVITGWNKSAERLFGYSAAEAVGQHIGLIVPEDRREEARGFLRRIGRGETVESHDTVRVAKDGRTIDVSISISSVKSEAGDIVGAAKIARDITEMKRVQEALRDSEQMARAVIDSAPDAFIQLDESGVIIDWNRQAEAIFGWPREEALGQNLGALTIPDARKAHHVERMSSFLQTARTQSLGVRFEEQSRRRDGSEFTAEVAVTALKLHSRYVFNGFVRDLTDKIAAEARLRQAQKMEAIGQLTGGIAHDFNNILTVIIGTNELLLEALSDRPDLAESAKIVDEAGERGAQLTSSLLAYARRQPLQPRETDINKIVAGVMKFLPTTLGEQIEIVAHLDSAAWRAFVDPPQLETALLNLVLNARDAMPNGGRLTIESNNVVLDDEIARINSDMVPGPYVMIAVSDTGVGIPAAIRDRVFEPFFTTKETGKGTGLGLSMTYGFIKQSSGHINIYSEEGHGTTIRLYLPRADAVASDFKGETTNQAVGGNETVLVVEDDAMVRRHAIALLQSLGYSVIAAASADEALAIVETDQPIDLLFTDVVMPGSLNGRALSEIARARRPSLRVLFTSGYTENVLVHRGRLDPGVLLLAKPYHKADLAHMIRVALSER